MAAALSSLPDDDTAPTSLEIRRVQTLAELHDFAAVIAANWTPPDPNVQNFYAATADVLLTPRCPQWLYVGYLENQPVAAAEGVVRGGVVGLYNICTRRTHRRLGFGAAMTLQPLLDARGQGCRSGVLQAAADGVRIYTRLGFKQFGTIAEYKPRFSD